MTFPDHKRFIVGVNEAPLKREISVLFSGEGDPVGGHFIGPAVHDYYLLHIVRSGKGSFETLGKRTECKAGDVFIIFPNILMKYEADRADPWTYTWVAFNGETSEEVLASVGISPNEPVIHDCAIEKFTSLMLQIRECLSQSEEANMTVANLKASGLLLLLTHELGAKLAHNRALQIEQIEGADSQASMLSKSKSQAYRQVDQAVRLFTLQYAQPLSIATIARTLGYHRAHLTKLFKEVTGYSPQQFLFRIRMKKAEQLLQTDLTIAQVAASVGYNDALFFTKQFRKWSGRSPTAFRNKEQNRTLL